ncbi:hypothetical protein [Lysobacter enzymogenes]|uniref:hypothetical protein n=1 Tax=Lysobacter enzymogenes TaxID=69 RepID=UPI0009CDACC4|nr:hypothetical protein [Lysobacter enzymogenes]UZW58827.1 hypothetical protein BV903_016095 [Lysobacter enzymogenes]
MPRLPVPSSAAALCMLAAAFACVAADAPTAVQQTADAAAVDLARGCWIRHAPARPDGRDTVLLRLLPDPERRDWLRGEIARVGDDPDRRLQLWLARDGRRALLSAASVRDPDAPAARVDAEPGPIPMWTPPGAVHPVPDLDQDGLARLLLGGDDRIAFGRSPRRLTAVGGAAGRSAEIDYRAEAGPPLRLRVNAAEERLSITVGGADIGTGAPLAVFAGVRDGCD